MGNISKKNRKKLVKVINANCHRVTHFGEQDLFLTTAVRCLLFGNISVSGTTVLSQAASWLIEAKNIFLLARDTVTSMLQNNCLFREHILKSTNKLSIDLKSATSFMLFITHGGKQND